MQRVEYFKIEEEKNDLLKEKGAMQQYVVALDTERIKLMQENAHIERQREALMQQALYFENRSEEAESDLRQIKLGLEEERWNLETRKAQVQRPSLEPNIQMERFQHIFVKIEAREQAPRPMPILAPHAAWNIKWREHPVEPQDVPPDVPLLMSSQNASAPPVRHYASEVLVPNNGRL